jgi:ribosomal protein S18 acetylase RimI-like enzyme
VVAPERDSPPAIAGGAGGGSSSKPRKAPEKKPLQFRAATRRDAAAIARLIGAEPSALSERLAAALRAEEPPVVAEQDGIVGATAWTVVAMLHGPPRGRITLLHVAPDARRQGIGRQLLAEAERQLAEQGVTTIELLLDIDLDAPAGFLRKTGWQRSANAYGKIIR